MSGSCLTVLSISSLVLTVFLRTSHATTDAATTPKAMYGAIILFDVHIVAIKQS